MGIGINVAQLKLKIGIDKVCAAAFVAAIKATYLGHDTMLGTKMLELGGAIFGAMMGAGIKSEIHSYVSSAKITGTLPVTPTLTSPAGPCTGTIAFTGVGLSLT